MELQNNFSNFTILSSFLFLLVLFEIVKRWTTSKNSTTNLPPGPWRLPFIGNIHQIITSPFPHHSFKTMAEKYGPLMYLKLGEVPYIIVSSPEIAKEVMKTQDLVFSNRPDLMLPKIFSYNNTDILYSIYGEHWRQLRKICANEVLSAKRVQSFRSIREEEVDDLVKSIAASEGTVVNLTHKITDLTHWIVARAAFGKKSKHQQVFRSVVDEISDLLGGFCIADLYPSIKMLERLSMSKTRFAKLHKELDVLVQDIVDDHKRIDREVSKDEDIVDVILKIQQQENAESQHPVTDINIKSIILDLFAPGTHTISGFMIWCMSEMVRNPKVMEVAQTEVRRVFDKKGFVDETEIHKLIYLKCVIKETLRLRPHAPLLVPRESRESCQINGFDIPAKTSLMVNVWAIGRDPRYWAEAESFKPERFLNNPIDFKGTDFEFIPFGAGRRICPGIAFSIATIELSLAKLLYHFDWKLPNDMKYEELDMSEKFGVTVRRKHDLCLIPIIRRL